MELIEGLKKRRTIRSFNDKEIDIKVIEKIIDATRFQPTWKNTQIVRFYFTNDNKKINEISENIGHDWNKNIIKNAKGVMVLAYKTNISGYEKDKTPSTTKGSHFESFDTGVMAEGFVLSCFNYGIGTVIMGIFDENRLKKVIGVKDDEAIACVIPMGYYDELPSPPKKKEVSELLNIVK